MQKSIRKSDITFVQLCSTAYVFLLVLFYTHSYNWYSIIIYNSTPPFITSQNLGNIFPCDKISS